MSFATYPDVTLADARAARDAARKLLNAGTDPMTECKAEKKARRTAADNSFATIARLAKMLVR